MKLRRRTSETRLELTPLIDVVFLLLVFFVFALVLMVRADALDLTLPSIGAGRPAERVEAVRITLDAEGAIAVNGEPVAIEGLNEAVTLAAGEADVSVVISADARAPAGTLIELADALVAAGITEFSVLGSPSDASGGEAPRAVPVNPAGSGDE